MGRGRAAARVPTADSAGIAGRIEAIFTRRGVTAAVATASLAAGLLTIAVEKIAAVDRYRTEVGQQRSVVLADGSRVRLNTATTIEVAMHGNQRVVHLVDGEALFDVAPDAPTLSRSGVAARASRSVAIHFGLGGSAGNLIEMHVDEGDHRFSGRSSSAVAK